MGVTVVNWNPQHPVLPDPLATLIPWRRPVNNFGDLLGPLLVDRLVPAEKRVPAAGVPSRRLLTVGSILQLAGNGDTVWGSGINGKAIDATYHFTHLDVRAVRGPLTRDFLRARGVTVPPVFGDPGLLVSRFVDRNRFRQGPRSGGLTIVPNLYDARSYPRSKRILDPRRPLMECIERIATSELVVGSSLHALIVAESFGVPARLIRSTAEPAFKYDDYYYGSGRQGHQPAQTIDEAVAMGGERPPQWDADKLLASFPHDLWD